MEIQPNEYIHNLQAPPGADKQTKNRIKCLNKLEQLIYSVEQTGTFPPVRKGQFTKLINAAKKNGLQDLAAEIEQLKTRYADIPKTALRNAAANDRAKRGREGDESDVEEAPALEAQIEPEDDLGVQPMVVVSDQEEERQQQLRDRITRLNMQRNAPAQRVARAVENLKEKVEALGRRFVQVKRAAGNLLYEYRRSVTILNAGMIMNNASAFIQAGTEEGPLGVVGALGYTTYKTAIVTGGLLLTAAALNYLAPQNPPQAGAQEGIQGEGQVPPSALKKPKSNIHGLNE